MGFRFWKIDQPPSSVLHLLPALSTRGSLTRSHDSCLSIRLQEWLTFCVNARPRACSVDRPPTSSDIRCLDHTPHGFFGVLFRAPGHLGGWGGKKTLIGILRIHTELGAVAIWGPRPLCSLLLRGAGTPYVGFPGREDGFVRLHYWGRGIRGKTTR